MFSGFYRKVILMISLFHFLVSGCTTSQVETSLIKVGLGEKVITPAENVQMDGFARSQVSTGVHDDLFARSLVIEDAEGTTIVMMTIALVAIPRDDFGVIRRGVNEKTAIPEDNILISGTHTHSGPRVRSAGEAYRRMYIERSIASAVEAWENRAPGRVGIASTEVMELGRNRRRLLYGGVHPDPEVGIIKIEDNKGKLLGVAFNYGCHTSGLDWRNTLFSEDWAYFAIRGIKKKFGDDVWAAYYQSAEGDINVGYLSELSAVGVDMPVRKYPYIELKGNQMADAVIKALPDIETYGGFDISTTIDYFEYPLRKHYPVTVEQAERDAKKAKETLARMSEKPEYAGTRILDNARVEVFSTGQRLRAAKRFYDPDRPKTRTIEHQAFRIGDAVFVTVPDEVFSEIGLAVKEQSPFEKTYIIGITNGYRGYLPSAKEFIEGDYEVDGSAYSPDAGKVCIDSCLEVIRRLSD